MTAMISNSTYDAIRMPLIVPKLEKILIWRDQNPHAARRITCGLALTMGALISLIDAVSSLALAILTFPLELGGIKFGRTFLARTLGSTYVSVISVTYAMYLNIAKVSVRKADNPRPPQEKTVKN